MVLLHKIEIVLKNEIMECKEQAMKRIHAVEFEDLPWVPAFLRDALTGFLQFMSHKMDFYKPLAPILQAAYRQSQANGFLDLASGGGGPWLRMAEHLKASGAGFQVTLSDVYPNHRHLASTLAQIKALDVECAYLPDPINALQVPAEQDGFRTMFLWFHHFRPAQAQAILQDAVNQGRGIAIFEAQQRSLSNLIQFAFSPLFVLFVLPFLKPNLKQILCTYLIPVIPLMVGWDGCVSVLRTYTVEEMQAMVADLDQAETYDWQIDKNTETPVPLPYLIGVPKQDQV